MAKVERFRKPEAYNPDSVYDQEEIDELQKALAIDRDALEDALLEQSDLLYRASQKLSLWISRRDATKQQLQIVEAKADEKIRHDAAVAGEKITEREVDAQKRLDPKVQLLQDELSRHNHTLAQFSNLKEAFQQRGYALKELVALWCANYYAQSSVDGSGSMIREHGAERARKSMNEQRKGKR